VLASWNEEEELITFLVRGTVQAAQELTLTLPASLGLQQRPGGITAGNKRKIIRKVDARKITRKVDERKITRKVDVRLPGRGNVNSNGARPVNLIIKMIVNSDQ
jgi:hypothetical protein